jgi:hypothetical protein
MDGLACRNVVQKRTLTLCSQLRIEKMQHKIKPSRECLNGLDQHMANHNNGLNVSEAIICS